MFKKKKRKTILVESEARWAERKNDLNQREDWIGEGKRNENENEALKCWKNYTAVKKLRWKCVKMKEET